MLALLPPFFCYLLTAAASKEKPPKALLFFLCCLLPTASEEPPRDGTRLRAISAFLSSFPDFTSTSVSALSFVGDFEEDDGLQLALFEIGVKFARAESLYLDLSPQGKRKAPQTTNCKFNGKPELG